MKEENYKKILGMNSPVQNAMALSYLLDVGRNNLLNETFYNEQITETENKYKENKGNFLMTKDFAVGIVKMAKQMALLEKNALYDFIHNEINQPEKSSNENENENDSIDYGY